MPTRHCIFNGSPLFTGDAGGGESEIRRWIIENGWLETIIALPDQLFYNTGILTYVWIVTNRKKGMRKGKVQLIDGTSFFERMRKPLGEKRKQISEEQKDELTRIYGEFMEGEFCKIFDEDDFAYWKVTVERPLRLNFQASAERIERIREQTAFANLATSRKRKPDEIAREVAEGKKQQPMTVERAIQSQKVATTALPTYGKRFFAFTATPKQKTLEIFGQRAATGKPEP